MSATSHMLSVITSSFVYLLQLVVEQHICLQDMKILVILSICNCVDV